MSDDQYPDVDSVDPEFEARARAAGRALREPAPARGFERVRAAKRRRTVAQAGAALAVAVLAVGGIFALVRSDGDELQPADAPSSVPAVIPTPVPTAPGQTATNLPAPTDPAATNAPSATAPEPVSTTDTPTTEAPAAEVAYVAAGQTLVPEWNDRTTAIAEPLADGLYWSDDYSSDGTTVSFRLVQRIRGQACIDEFGDGADDACASDGGRITEPSTTVTMSADTPDVSIILFDNSTIAAYRVPAAEFIRLAAGAAPSPGAPEGYVWQPWGTGVVISGGRVVAAHQEFQS